MPMKKKGDDLTVRRKIFSLYEVDLQRLRELCVHADIKSQSLLIRELIMVAYTERIKQKKEVPCFYGEESNKF